MSCGKCGSGSKGFCPVTLGLALGLTVALLGLFCSAWAIWFGMPEFLGDQAMKVADNWSDAGMRAVFGLVKGFVVGFVFALIYDFICCCKAKCCGKCKCCSTDPK